VIRLERYTVARRAWWDAFVRASKNGTFLFERGYMDYHADRFVDHSLIALHGERIAALLPANERAGSQGDTLISHGGLTFGGWITDYRLKLADMLAIFEALGGYARENGIERLIYKSIPSIYQRAPADEDGYALFTFGARLTDRRPATVLCGAPLFPKDRRYEVRKAEKAGVHVAESDDYAAYWQLLESVLRDQHESKPVHTLTEIEALQRAFPDNIRLYGAFLDGQMVAGVLMYISAMVARTQYMASGELGRAVGALDALIDHLVHVAYMDRPYFDFGTSIEPTTGAINRGLLAYKEDFGARAVLCDTYTLEWT